MKTQVRTYNQSRKRENDRLVMHLLFFSTIPLLSIFEIFGWITALVLFIICLCIMLLIIQSIRKDMKFMEYEFKKWEDLEALDFNAQHHQYFFRNKQIESYVSDHIFWELKSKIIRNTLIGILRFMIIVLIFGVIPIIFITSLDTVKIPQIDWYSPLIFLILIFWGIWNVILKWYYQYKVKHNRRSKRHKMIFYSFRKKQYLISTFRNSHWEKYYFIQ